MHSFICCNKNIVQLKADEKDNKGKNRFFLDGLKQEYNSEWISVFNTLLTSKYKRVLVRYQSEVSFNDKECFHRNKRFINPFLLLEDDVFLLVTKERL